MVASMGGHKRALTWKSLWYLGCVLSVHRSLVRETTDCQSILTSTVQDLSEANQRRKRTMVHRERRPRMHTARRHGIAYQCKDATGPHRAARRIMQGQVLVQFGRTRTTCTEFHQRRPSEAARCGLPYHSQCLLRSGAEIATRRGLFRHWRRKSTRNQGLTWTHGSTQGCCTFDSTSQSSTKKLFTTLQLCEKDKKRHWQYRKATGGSWSHWHLSTAQ